MEKEAGKCVGAANPNKSKFNANINSVIESIIVKEFPKFLNKRNEIRKKLIEQNDLLKIKYINNTINHMDYLDYKKEKNPDCNILGQIVKSIYSSPERDTDNYVDINKINDQPIEENINKDNINSLTFPFVNDPNNFLHNGNLHEFYDPINEDTIYLSNYIDIPKGIFVYPVSQNVKVKDKLELENMIKVDNLEKFEDLISATYDQLKELFISIPHNKDITEKIDNKEFIVWIFLKIKISLVYRMIFNIENVEIVEKVAHLLDKKLECVFKIISTFFQSLIKKWRYERNKALHKVKNETYRETYCKICMMYLCQPHFDFVRKDINVGRSNSNAKMYKEVLERKYPNFKTINQPPKKLITQTQNKITMLASRAERVPCNHSGPCNKSTCQCVLNVGYCEKYCPCWNFCEYMAKGCDCADGCSMAQSGPSCICAKIDRECDPDLCHKKSKGKKCSNMAIILEKPKKTCLAKSILGNFYGLFALEDIRANEFICDYKGEMINCEETERRYVFMDYLGLNYLFNIYDNTDVDAYRVGNQARYVNHSSHGYQNCYTKDKFVRGNYHIAFYSSRDIKKGEELFFDYNFSKKLNWVQQYNRLYGKK